MKTDGASLYSTLSFPAQRVLSWFRQRFDRSFGLKAKITFLLIFIVTGVLLLSSYLDYHFSTRDQIDLYMNRNVFIAKQIDIGLPDPRITNNFSRIDDEMEEWLLSRTFLMEIDLLLFTPKGWQSVVSHSKADERVPLTLSESQIGLLKKDKDVAFLRDVGDERWLEVIVPLHREKRVIGGIRLASTLDEARSYLGKKRERAIILTLSSILIILISLTVFFGKLVGNPIQQLIGAISRAEKGDLEAEVPIQRRDELGELAKDFNRMLRTIREAHEQNVQLLSRVNQFNEELTRKIEAATSELAKRNEELRLLNEALFESQRQLSQSEKLAALGQVTAAMAHQIGTPLNSISGYIQLMLEEGNLQPQDQNRLKIVESQLDRLADSVKSILSFTQQPKPQLRPLNVNNVLEELILLSEPWFHTRKIRLVTSLSADLPPVLADPTLLQTLFLNLITNAVDAMPQGGDLTLRTRPVLSTSSSGNGRWVEVSVSDTGIGITEETKKRIFDPFFTTKKIGEGSGLGLAICYKIVKEHSGQFNVESEVGKGSAFTVLFPASKA